MTCICFSKDRPFQLSEYLRTLLEHAVGELNIYILYTYSDNEYKVRYDKLIKRYPKVTFIKERNFYQDFTNILNQVKDEYVLFGVDDVIFIRELHIKEAEEALKADSKLVGVSLRLHPGCTKCQPHNMADQVIPKTVYTHYDFNVFNYDEGTYDWNYPFDLSASIYRLQDIKKWFSKLTSSQLSHPNTIEGNVAAQFANTSGRLAGVKYPTAITITVNRVQNVAKNLVLHEIPAKALNSYFDKSCRFDINAYRKVTPNCIHFGEFYIA